jgi:all-trans-retinol 13,14-reductase
MMTDGQLQWAPMDSNLDTFIFGDDVYEMSAGDDRGAAKLKGYFGQDAAAIDEYYRLIRSVERSFFWWMPTRIGPPWKARLLSPPGAGSCFRRFSARHTGEVLAGLTSNERLRAVLAGRWGTYGLPPKDSAFSMHAIVERHYTRGGNYPVGGAAAMAEKIIPGIERAGGLVVVNAEVAQIRIWGSRAIGVRLSDGHELTSDYVISDAGLPNTFGRLVARSDLDRLGLGQIAAGLKPSTAYINLYLGFEESDQVLGNKRTGNLWWYPSYDHDANHKRFFADIGQEPPSMFVSFQSVKDPAWERHHPGTSTVQGLVPCPYAPFARWEDTVPGKRGREYDEFKARLTERMLERLYRIVPHLRGKPAHVELSTPLSTRHYMSHLRGEMLGVEHTPERFACPALRPYTPIKGLLLTGADALIAGVCGAMGGGVLCALTVLGLLRGRHIVRHVLPWKFPD